MIKSNELRIGNWVMYKENYLKVLSITNARLLVSTFEIGITEIDYNDLEPIKTTPELLLKAGFKKDSDGCTMIPYSSDYNMYWLDGGYLQIAKCFAPLINSPCQYVHTLQNLIFALIGKELNIKL